MEILNNLDSNPMANLFLVKADVFSHEAIMSRSKDEEQVF